MSQSGERFSKIITKELKINYLLYLPNNYGKDQQQKWPLVLFLHGAGERGDDIEVVKRNGIPKLADSPESDKAFSFIAISPQCPGDSSWEYHFDELDFLLEKIQEKYNVDEDRVYVTGLSMGGYGTWDLAMMYPNRFAAIVPICGGSTYPELVGLLGTLPIWAFHGAKDNIVPVEETRLLISALEDINQNLRYTEYPEAGHDSWTETYNNPEVYKWLLEQKRRTSVANLS